MREIKISVAKTLETLKANREQHAKDYREAMENWEALVLKRLTKVRREAGKGNFENVQSPLRDLPKPEKFLDEYDEAIRQLEWEVETEVTLLDHEFKQYIMDEWGWNARFVANTSAYLR